MEPLKSNKILLVTLEYPPFYGGVASYYQGLVNNWPEVSVLAHHPHCQQLNKISPQVFNLNFYFAKVWPKWLRLFLKLWPLAKNKTYDSIWVGQILPIGTVALLLKLIWGQKYFVSSHGFDLANGSRSWFKNNLCRWIISQAEFVTCNSHYTESLLKSIQPNKKSIVIYPCPRMIGDFSSKTNFSPDIKLLTVSRLEPRKNQLLVIRSLPELLKIYPRLKYYIIGTGSFEPTLKQEILKLNLSDQVIMLGALSDQETKQWYSQADVFILPVLDLYPSVEGFGIVYLEANSFGLPVVACATGGVTEAVADQASGLIITPTTTSLISALTQLLASPESYAKISSSACQWAKKFSYSTEAEKLKQYYGQ